MMTAPLTRRALREQQGDAAVREGPEPVSERTRPLAARFARGVADLALWAAAIVGLGCIVLVVLALTADITLIMFRTGSMSPTIPAGSVAVVQRIPADDVAVGDVVTVDREGDLPVTHRVTSVSAGGSPEERVITMQGDANASADPYPYAVTTVRVVLMSVPGIASVIVMLGEPLVLGLITIAASGLVIWAFWPRDPSGRSRREKAT